MAEHASLWKTGLDIDGLQAMLTALELTGTPPRLRTAINLDLAKAPLEVAIARLSRDKSMETRLSYGAAIVDGISYYYEGDSWADAMSSGLIRAITDRAASQIVMLPPPNETSEADIKHVADLIFTLLKLRNVGLSLGVKLLEFLFTLPNAFEIDELALTVATLSDPELMKRVPQLHDRNIYGKYASIVSRDLTSKNLPSISRHRLSDEAIAAVREVLIIPRERKDASGAIFLRQEFGMGINGE